MAVLAATSMATMPLEYSVHATHLCPSYPSADRCPVGLSVVRSGFDLSLHA